ncbi:hypothetical protein EI546_03645 [Aequorivita sp. H23M31]|uniref:Uncharacterized protein n=1 Tax=Aequorivita ciconiae TaxID=2494375 RepID=A0A410G0T2_9FLAO|nr:hypothetical protein [Aequorivita sp. H23M31]QAA80877.1 hypothetical protein EI546_03645 [Aequorivita sp. H23M31]
MNRRIVEYLYHGFMPYVPKDKLEAYNNEFNKKGKNSLGFVKEFFPRYVDIPYYHKFPIRDSDAFLFNYFVIDLELYGLKQTNTFKKFKRYF